MDVGDQAKPGSQGGDGGYPLAGGGIGGAKEMKTQALKQIGGGVGSQGVEQAGQGLMQIFATAPDRDPVNQAILGIEGQLGRRNGGEMVKVIRAAREGKECKRDGGGEGVAALDLLGIGGTDARVTTAVAQHLRLLKTMQTIGEGVFEPSAGRTLIGMEPVVIVHPGILVIEQKRHAMAAAPTGAEAKTTEGRGREIDKIKATTGEQAIPGGGKG